MHWLVVISIGIGLAGAAAYIRDIRKGTTKPNLVTWFLWAIAPLIGTGAAISAHADIWGTARIFLAGFIPLIVICFAFANKRSYWKLGRFDYLCGTFSLLALIIWLSVGLPKIAIVFAALADGFAAIQTIRKAWRHPETETGITHVSSLLGVLLVLPSIPNWQVENWAFQAYLVVCNSLLVIAVYRNRIFKSA